MRKFLLKATMMYLYLYKYTYEYIYKDTVIFQMVEKR